jgi:hypothetical protein
MTLICQGCCSSFSSSRGLNTHWQFNPQCRSKTLETYLSIFQQSNQSETVEFNNNDIILENCNEYTNEEFVLEAIHDMSLIEKKNVFKQSGKHIVTCNMNIYKASIELLNLLESANCSLSMYDEILKWATRAHLHYQIDFLPSKILPREKFVNNLKEQFDLKGLDPKIENVYLPGSDITIELVIHDFKASFYTLLCDENLMKEENLLINKNQLFDPPCSLNKDSEISDINTGEVWRIAYKKYINNEKKEVLCPIIMFIDKTHTDLNGRLCIEQIRFTLGIFNYQTRNLPSAWRSLGYVMDAAHLPTKSPIKRVMDYQSMLKSILNLSGFIKSQKDAIGWNLIFNDTSHLVFFRIPVMFIIGDTDGHDHISGRYLNRTNISVKRLCRYCDCPFMETDNPNYKFKYVEQKQINRHIERNQYEILANMSLHCFENAWKDVLFCDNVRGIFGATLAENMHCMQHGLFLYVIQSLFDQKKISKNKTKQSRKNTKQGKRQRSDSYQDNEIVNNNEEDDQMSLEEIFSDESGYESDDDNWDNNVTLGNHYAFSESYSNQIDDITRMYGKYLMHQCDRDLPRTHFASKYTTIKKKNANEMSGVMITFLMVFSSQEGDNIDKKLGDKRSAQYIHLFELLLMLENFCMSDVHKRSDILALRLFMPSLMQTLKKTINRKTGLGMKIIKFHLLLHFADDMLRMGTMINYDSGIPESHHKVFAKKPSKRTQRRKHNFEKQTACRQIDNLAITRAYNTIFSNKLLDEHTDEINKNYSIEYHHDLKDLFLNNRSKKKSYVYGKTIDFDNSYYKFVLNQFQMEVYVDQ